MRWIVILMVWPMESVALATDSQLSRCRAIDEPFARLACYDAIESATNLPAQFGRERQGTEGSTQAMSVQTYIPGVFEGWQARTRISLANGQVWQVSDDSSGTYRLVDPKVILRRGMLGSFFLELVGEHRTIRVRRVD